MLSLSPPSLYDTAYALMVRFVSMTKEEHEAMDKLEGRIIQILKQQDTGLPPIASLIPPSDQRVDEDG